MILAGGLSRRMGGGNKWLLPLGGRPLVERVWERLAPQVSAVALNANIDAATIAGAATAIPPDLPLLPDTVADRPGPLAGILAAMTWAAGLGADRVVTVAGDTPFFPPDLVARLAEAADRAGAPIALAATEEDGRRHPTFGLWSVGLADDLAGALAGGTRKIVAWTDAHGAVAASFPGDPFFNLNTPEDFAAAEAMVS